MMRSTIVGADMAAGPRPPHVGPMGWEWPRNRSEKATDAIVGADMARRMALSGRAENFHARFFKGGSQAEIFFASELWRGTLGGAQERSRSDSDQLTQGQET
jgi:hypothetical protein